MRQRRASPLLQVRLRLLRRCVHLSVWECVGLCVRAQHPRVRPRAHLWVLAKLKAAPGRRGITIKRPVVGVDAVAK